MYLFKNTLITLVFSLIYPFIINIIPSLIIFYTLKDMDGSHECLFKINKIIQLI